MPESTRQRTKVYQNPPVHEVVLDIQFHQEIDDEPLRGLVGELKGRFDFQEPPVAVAGQEIVMSVGLPNEPPRVRQLPRGWLFKSVPPGWILSAQKRQLTLHVVRPGSWPSGPYIGWSEIRKRYASVFALIAPTYDGCDIKRIGLRYLNRVAVPHGDDLDDWFTLRFENPEFLDGLYSFSHKQTWVHCGGGEDLSVTLNLAMIKIDDETIARDHAGVLLDIDVFNLLVQNAPDLAAALDWFDRAHVVENAVFEASVTDRARKEFDRASD